MIELLLSFFLSIFSFGGQSLEANAGHAMNYSDSQANYQMVSSWKVTKVKPAYTISSQVEKYDTDYISLRGVEGREVKRPVLRHKGTNHIVTTVTRFKPKNANYDKRIGAVKVFKTKSCAKGKCRVSGNWI